MLRERASVLGYMYIVNCVGCLDDFCARSVGNVWGIEQFSCA